MISKEVIPPTVLLLLKELKGEFTHNYSLPWLTFTAFLYFHVSHIQIAIEV